MTLPEGMARCIRCGKIKPLGQFYPSSKAKNGHQWYCIDCSRIDSKRRHEQTKAARELRHNKSAAELRRQIARLRAIVSQQAKRIAALEEIQ